MFWEKSYINIYLNHKFLSALQSGVIPGYSTRSHLINIYKTFCKSLDKGKEAVVVFCKTNKAFERV